MSSRSDKEAIASPAAPVSPRPTALSPRSPRPGDKDGEASDVGDGRSLAASIKSFRRKKVVQPRLHPLESESPRRQRPPHQQRLLSVASPSPPQPSSSLHSPRLSTQELVSPDDEVLQLQRLQALSTSDETVEQWIRTYEAERGAFASFAVFTEVKLDEVQETYVQQAGRPSAVEAAACCATLLKMPGIVGCYKTLLEKVATGIQAAVYLPEASPAADASVPPAMAAIVRRFYSRTPYFARVRELEKALSSSRSLSDPSVLRAISSDDVARIFQYVPFRHVQAGLAKVYATNSSMLDQLADALRAQQGLLLRSRGGDASPDDPEYPVHVPLATSAQICRAIAQHAASFSSSGRDMILCAILEYVDVDSFRDVFKRFDTQGKVCFLHHLSLLESSDQLQMVVDALPNAGESLFRLYFVACTGQGGGFSGESGPSDQQPLPANPKDVFFANLLSPEMEFFFLCDLATYLSGAQWQMLSREVERNESERKARRLQQSSAKATTEFEADIDEDSSASNAAQTLSAAASLDHFQMMMWKYLRHHTLSSAQLLQLVANTFLSALEEKEFGQLLDSCWARFPLDGQWAKVLAVVQDLDTGRGLSSPSEPPSASQPAVNNDYIAAIRLKLVKKLFSMLSREEREAWMDRMNAKHPTDNYKKKLQELKNAAAVVVTSAPPDFSDPAVHLAFMKADLKMRWLEAIMESLLSDPAHSAQMTQLKQTLQASRTGKAPSPPAPSSKPTLLSAEKTFQQLLSQLSASDKAALLAKFAPPSTDAAPTRHADTLERATSPVPSLEPEQSSRHPSISSPVLDSLKELLERSSESEVLELLQHAMAAATERQDAPFLTKAADAPLDQDATDAANAGLGHTASLSNRLRRRLSAVTAVAEPMEWQEFVKVGCLDVGCQTSFDGDPQASPSSEDGVLDASNGAISPRGALRGSVAPGKMVPLTLNSLLGKSALSSGAKKDRKESGTKYQKINNTTVPRAISGLITSWRMNADQLVQFAKKSLPNVLKIIADAYSDMLTAGRRKIQQQRQQAYATQRGSGRELTLAQIVYQSFLHSYGLPGIADMHLLAFSCALETYRLQHLRVEYFARFCFEEVPKVELLNYLEFLECLVCDDVSAAFLGMNHLSSPTTPASPRSSLNSRGPSPPQQQQQSSTVATRLRFVPRINVPDKENWQVSVERAQEVAQLCFRDMRKTAVTAFCEQLALLAVSGTSTAVLSVATGGSGNASSTETTTSTANAAAATGGELLLNVDHLLQLVVHEWRDEQTRRERHLLDTFRAGDVNGDGQLTSAEFTQIVLSIDATRELGDILLMYSDTLRRVQCEQLDAQVFLQVAREHELDRAVWLGDGDLYSVVNEVTDMEATWTHVRGFFLGTLEALARDLPAAHFLRVCEGAGCGCLKCLLDGYIGFQKMRREFALSSAPKPSTGRRNSVVGVSSQLVWARFWHLMRQLHDAAAQSDGLVTPWEGSDIVTRETPAPPLAPRILARRRHALPNFLFPDTARISAQISAVHDPEAFDADAINAQFAYLLSHISVKTPEATPHASGGQQKPRRASFPASS